MYIIVNNSTKKIIGTAAKPMDEEDSSKRGYLIYEIPDSEFSPSMLGATLEGFDVK